MSLLTKGLILALVVVGALLGIQTWRVRRAQAAQIQAAMNLSNERAAHDTTRVLDARALAAVHKMYGDSLTAVTKRIEQLPQRPDAVSGTLGSRPAGHIVVGVGGSTSTGTAVSRPPAPTVAGAPVSRCDSCARLASFDVRAAPFTSHADVAIRAAGRDSITLTTTLDRATLTARLECGAPEEGVRPASIVVVGPPWLGSTVESGQLEPRVCNPDLGKHPRRWSLGIAGGFGAVLSGGRVLAGPSVTAGLMWTLF